jgi:hypothetical protein
MQEANDMSDEIDRFIQAEECTVLMLRNLKKLLQDINALKAQIDDIKTNKMPDQYKTFRDEPHVVRNQVTLAILKEKEKKATTDLAVVASFFGVITEQLDENIESQKEALTRLQALAHLLL